MQEIEKLHRGVIFLCGTLRHLRDTHVRAGAPPHATCGAALGRESRTHSAMWCFFEMGSLPTHPCAKKLGRFNLEPCSISWMRLCECLQIGGHDVRQPKRPRKHASRKIASAQVSMLSINHARIMMHPHRGDASWHTMISEAPPRRASTCHL